MRPITMAVGRIPEISGTGSRKARGPIQPIPRLSSRFFPLTNRVWRGCLWARVIDPGVVARVDPQTFTRVRPVLDPLTVDPLRRAAFQTREARQRIDVPQTVAQRIANTPVITSTNPS